MTSSYSKGPHLPSGPRLLRGQESLGQKSPNFPFEVIQAHHSDCLDGQIKQAGNFPPIEVAVHHQDSHFQSWSMQRVESLLAPTSTFPGFILKMATGPLQQHPCDHSPKVPDDLIKELTPYNNSHPTMFPTFFLYEMISLLMLYFLFLQPHYPSNGKMQLKTTRLLSIPFWLKLVCK